MPRLRLAARFLQGRSSPPAASCTSCEAASAAAAAAGTSSSSSSSPLNPSSPFSRAPVTSSALPPVEVEQKRFLRLLGILPYPAATTSAARDRSCAHARPPVGYLHLSGSSPVGDPQRDLISFRVQQRIASLGQRSPSRSFSAAYSTNSDHDPHDLHERPQEPEIPILSRLENSAVGPSLQKCEEEEETEVVGDEEEDFIWQDNTPAPGESRGSTTLLLYDNEEEGVITEWDAALSTSSSEDDESDLSELEFLKIDDGLAENQDDGNQLEAEDSRFEEDGDLQWTGSSLDQHMPLEASKDKDEGASELLADFLDVVSTTAEDCREGEGEGEGEGGVLAESSVHGDHHDDGVPYLHALSVGEVREILEKARAKDVRILQVQKCCEWVDHLVFASGRSSRHLRGMADAIVYKVKQLSENVGPNSFPLVEGREGEQWMAVDCGSIVVHLFLEEARSYYDLEEFWTKKSNPRLVETY